MNQVAPTPNPAETLAKTLFRAAAALGLSDTELAAIMGVDPSTVRRTRQRGYLDPHTKAGEIAALVLRVYRSLYALTGGAPGAMAEWMHTGNGHVNGIPAQRMGSLLGLAEVVAYLDGIRAKV